MAADQVIRWSTAALGSGIAAVAPADVTAVAGLPGWPPDADPLQMQVAQVFADDLAAGRAASVRTIETRVQLCSRLLSL